MKFFPHLVESIFELKRFTRKFLAEHQKITYAETDSQGELDLPSGFRVVYSESSDYYYCLSPGQGLMQRVYDLTLHEVKPEFLKDRQTR